MYVTLFTVNVSGTMHLIGHSVKIDDEKHIKITDLRLKEQEIGDMKIFATNLINGNPELSKSVRHLPHDNNASSVISSIKHKMKINYSICNIHFSFPISQVKWLSHSRTNSGEFSTSWCYRIFRKVSRKSDDLSSTNSSYKSRTTNCYHRTENNLFEFSN